MEPKRVARIVITIRDYGDQISDFDIDFLDDSKGVVISGKNLRKVIGKFERMRLNWLQKLRKEDMELEKLEKEKQLKKESSDGRTESRPRKRKHTKRKSAGATACTT